MSESGNGAPKYLPVGDDGHEERIQRLETGSQEQAVRLEKVATKQDFLTQQLHDTRVDLVNRLDSGFGKLAAFDERVTSTLETHTKLLGAYDERLRPLETSIADQQKTKLERKELLKKIAIGALLAAAGVFATKGGEMLWSWFGK